MSSTQLIFNSEADEPCGSGDIKFSHNILAVGSHCLRTDEKSVCYFGIAFGLGNQAEDFEFSPGKIVFGQEGLIKHRFLAIFIRVLGVKLEAFTDVNRSSLDLGQGL